MASGGAGQGPAQSSQLQLLRGSGPGQFNLDQVRVRASELRSSLAEVLNALQVQPELLSWEAILKKYATVNLQVLTLRESLRGILRQVLVHPCMVDQPALSTVLPIQLASGVWPEQEQAEQVLLTAEERRLLVAGIPADAWYEAVDVQAEQYNRLISHLTSAGGCLDQQGEARKAVTSRSQAINKALTLLRKGGVAALAPAPGSKRSRAAAAAAGADGENKLDPALRQLLTGEQEAAK